jgi:hypothetical protein
MACTDSSYLPPEIVNLVIDESRGDVKALAQLGLVAPSTYWRTREHLFDSVELCDSVKTEKLRELLQGNAALSGYVRTLSVVDRGDPDEKAENSDQCLSKWLQFSADDLVPLLPLLSSVSSFCLAGAFHQPLLWRSLPAALQIAVFDFIAMPQMAHVNLTCIYGIPVSPFAQFHHLVELVLRLVLTEGSDSLPLNAAAKLPSQPKQVTRLRGLTIGTCGRFLEVLLTCLEDSKATMNIRDLEFLRLDFTLFTDTMVPGLNMVLSRCVQNVSSLHVYRGGPDGKHRTFLIVSSCLNRMSS